MSPLAFSMLALLTFSSARAVNAPPGKLFPREALTWTSVNHTSGKGAKLWVLNSHSGEPFGEATWHFTDGNGQLFNLKPLDFTMNQVYSLHASPDGKTLAVGSAGEGHPMVHLVSLPDVLMSQPVKPTKEIDPYPGYVNTDGWRGQKLVLVSDRILSLPPKKDGDQGPLRYEFEVATGKSERFLLDPQTGDITADSKALRDLVTYYGKHVERGVEQAYDASLASLEKLADKRAIPYLEKALKTTKNAEAKASIEAVLKKLKG